MLPHSGRAPQTPNSLSVQTLSAICLKPPKSIVQAQSDSLLQRPMVLKNMIQHNFNWQQQGFTSCCACLMCDATENIDFSSSKVDLFQTDTSSIV